MALKATRGLRITGFNRCFNTCANIFCTVKKLTYEVFPEIRGQVQLVKNLATYLYKMYRVFISIILEANGMKIVEIITCTLKIPAKVPLLVSLAGATQKVMTRCYAVSNLNSAETLFSMNFPSKYTSFEITFILILFQKFQMNLSV